MLSDFLNLHNIKSQAKFILANGYGYGQVEPNHLSAQGTKEVYAQLPAAKAIKVLEQGQFAKYDYINNQVNFTGDGDWLLVYNEIKLYREHQSDCEFALIADDYQARVYSPFGYGIDKDGAYVADEMWDRQARFLNGADADGNTSITLSKTFTAVSDGKGGQKVIVDGVVCAVVDGDDDSKKITYDGADYTLVNGKVTVPMTYAFDDVTRGVDPYEIYSTEDPMHFVGPYKERMMSDLGEVSSMVPRLLGTHKGDIYTTNMINEESVAVGDKLYVGDLGMLTKTKKTVANVNGAVSGDMVWQVVKVYTMPDHQPGVKVMRIA